MLKSRSFRLKIYRTRQPLIGLGLVCAGSILLVSCSTMMSEMPTQAGGLPAGPPERPAVAPVYPAVHDMPPPRPTAVLTEEEKKKVEAELAAMRAEQARRAAARGAPNGALPGAPSARKNRAAHRHPREKRFGAYGPRPAVDFHGLGGARAG